MERSQLVLGHKVKSRNFQKIAFIFTVDCVENEIDLHGKALKKPKISSFP
jgi:hypothetical protein